MLASSFLPWAYHLLTQYFHPPEYCSLSVTHQPESIDLSSLPSTAVRFPFHSSTVVLGRPGGVPFQVWKWVLVRRGPLHIYICISHTGPCYKGQQARKPQWRVVCSCTAMNSSPMAMATTWPPLHISLWCVWRLTPQLKSRACVAGSVTGRVHDLLTSKKLCGHL